MTRDDKYHAFNNLIGVAIVVTLTSFVVFFAAGHQFFGLVGGLGIPAILLFRLWRQEYEGCCGR